MTRREEAYLFAVAASRPEFQENSQFMDCEQRSTLAPGGIPHCRRLPPLSGRASDVLPVVPRDCHFCQSSFARAASTLGAMTGMVDQTYLVAFKQPSQAIQHVIAATVEVQGEHLVFLDAEGKLAALFMMEIVQSWNVLPAAHSFNAMKVH